MTQTGSVAEGRLSDWISLGVLASWVPRDAVDDAVEAAGKGAKRKGGKLPPHVMVYFAMALALFAEEDYEETWVRLSETLADWGCWDSSQGTVTTGGLTQARQRLGHEPVKEVFSQVAVPPAGEDTPGAFLGPWRKMSMDGLEWDVPATEANIAAFGFSGTGADGSTHDQAMRCTGMNCLCAGTFGNFDQCGNVQVTLAGLRWADMVCFISHANM